MSMVSKLARMAQKKLAQQGSGSSTSGSGQTDWKALVRTASDAITGDGKNGRPGQQGRQDGYGNQGGQGGYGRPVGDDRRGGYDRQGGYAPTSAGQARPGAQGSAQRSGRAPSGTQADRAAVARYDYLLQTADPQQVEQVHREAFERLTPAQRALVEERMQQELPQGERPRSSSPDDLARAAARTEAREPGLLKGLLARVGTRGDARGAGASGGGASSGLGRGAVVGGAAAAGLAAGGLLTVVAGGAVLSSVAGPLLEQAVGAGVDFDSIAGAVDLEGIASGLDITGGVDELANGAGEAVSGFGEQIKDLGSGFGIPGLDDLLGR